jgi:hypothetical protein
MDAGLMKHPSERPNSNYLEWIGKRAGMLVDKDFVKEIYPNSQEYEEFVMDYEPPENIKNSLMKLNFDW